MISLTVSLQVVPGHLAEFVEAIRTQAERSFTDEPGCLYFDVGQDTADDHHFTLYELYADEAAVEAHRQAPHFKVWREAVAEHVVPGSQANTLATRRVHHSAEDPR
ncbi:antibiotic biosynthesis monooxygenase [Kribbella turkmenica]|uniref:Antibiotic biosynthesis monooxygenase n=1 Tax=Kribbella turkmenica TaxID=2530375 RepID=A0A4R4XD25_9ACTN|nr:putative quinol monooxygenase [Kribbella turkmenica]TDD28339.1 antibiotic biosynthesis monooxygenase [Kribbella turkmenica]